MGEKISILIPAFNEEQNLFSNIKQIEKTVIKFSKKNQMDYEIIIINDGSTDNTYNEAIRIHQQNNNIKVINYTQNGGKGKALQHGFTHVTGQYIFFMDADLDISPTHMFSFFTYLKKTGADVVVGSKRHPKSKIHYPLSRKIVSEIYQLINFFLFRLDLADTQSGFKVFKYAVLREVFPYILCKKYAFDLELLVNAHYRKWNIVEHPIAIDWQRTQSRIHMKDIWQIMLDTAAIFYRLRILKHYNGQKRIISPTIHKVYDVLYDGIGK